MRKSDKKTDNAIRLELTGICESALEDIKGFLWLTHIVDYDKFPLSLKVICVFDTNDNLTAFNTSNYKGQLKNQIKSGLQAIGVQIKSIDKHVFFDSQEACDIHHNGQWAARFQRVIH